MGAPINSLRVDETVTIRDDDIANYQRCLAKLDVDWEYALSENRRIANQFKVAADHFVRKAVANG